MKVHLQKGDRIHTLNGLYGWLKTCRKFLFHLDFNMKYENWSTNWGSQTGKKNSKDWVKPLGARQSITKKSNTSTWKDFNTLLVDGLNCLIPFEAMPPCHFALFSQSIRCTRSLRLHPWSRHRPFFPNAHFLHCAPSLPWPDQENLTCRIGFDQFDQQLTGTLRHPKGA